jgi:hypothetical protein
MRKRVVFLPPTYHYYDATYHRPRFPSLHKVAIGGLAAVLAVLWSLAAYWYYNAPPRIKELIQSEPGSRVLVRSYSKFRTNISSVVFVGSTRISKSFILCAVAGLSLVLAIAVIALLTKFVFLAKPVKLVDVEIGHEDANSTSPDAGNVQPIREEWPKLSPSGVAGTLVLMALLIAMVVFVVPSLHKGYDKEEKREDMDDTDNYNQVCEKMPT